MISITISNGLAQQSHRNNNAFHVCLGDISCINYKLVNFIIGELLLY